MRDARGRGFTLIESVVVAGLLGLALFGTLALVTNFSTVLNTHLTQSEDARQVREMHRQFERDLAAARPCTPQRVEPFVFGDSAAGTADDRRVGGGEEADTIRITASFDGDAIVHIRWRAADGALSRSVLADNGSCVPGDFDAVTAGGPEDLPVVTTTRYLNLVDDGAAEGERLFIGRSSVELDVRTQTAAGGSVAVERSWLLPTGRNR